MVVAFDEARGIIAAIAVERARTFGEDEDVLPLEKAIGRIPKYDLRCPIATPTFDSAAMDGYAVLLRQTMHATPEHPVQLRVMGYMTAGKPPFEVDDRVIDGVVPCVEIKTGAPFPTARSTNLIFDAFVSAQHAAVVRVGGEGKIVQIDRQPLTSWHKRIAGSDFRKGDLILEKGCIIAPKHVMALASVGVKEIAVKREVRVGVISVGSELESIGLPQQQGPNAYTHTIPDSNGPYLAAALHEMGMEATYLGALPGHSDTLTSCLREHIASDYFDLIIATEGAMSGNFEIIPRSIATLNGTVHFNQVALNPGFVTLFASLPKVDGIDLAQRGFYGYGNGATPSSNSSNMSQRGFYSDRTPSSSNSYGSPPMPPTANPGRARRSDRVEFFGLPGAPMASAACFRFLVTPYLRSLTGMPEEFEMHGKVVVTTEAAFGRDGPKLPVSREILVESSDEVDIFRHGVLRSKEDGVTAEISKDRRLIKTSPFASSNCWVHIPRGTSGVREGDIVALYPFCSPKS